MRLNPYCKRFLSVFLFLLFILAQSPAQEKPMITVLPFSSIEVPAYVSQIISQLFETHLVNTKGYDVLSQNEREQILAAQSESLEGCTDESCAIEIGRMLAAEQVILGTVAALGTKYIINAKIIDVTTSKTLGADMISAASVEDLDSACKTLTFSLVEKALPEALAEPEPEPEPTPEPEVAEEPEPTPEPEGEAEVAEEPAPVPEAEPAPAPEKAPPAPAPASTGGGIGLNSFLLAGGSVLQAAGNFLYASAHPVLIESINKYNEYMSAGSDPGSLYENNDEGTSYQDYQEAYSGLNMASLGLSAGGGIVNGLNGFIADGGRMSMLGRILYSAGACVTAGGNIFGQAASSNLVTANRYYQEYLTAEMNVETLWNRYSNFYSENYEMPRYTSFGMWGAGMALMAAAPFMPGNKTAVAPGMLNKILATAGSFLMAGGNFLGIMSQNVLVEAFSAFDVYSEATSGLDELYALYDNAYGTYELLTYTSYGLWIGGALAVAASMFIPGPSGSATAELPVSLDIRPAPVGFGAEIHIHTR